MNVAVFCGSSIPRSERYADDAKRLGAALAAAGHTLVYGGSSLGLMGAVSGAAMTAGGRVVAVIPTFFTEEIIASQPVHELIRVDSMAERKERIMAMSDAFVALPGGIGTIDEVSEVMVANQLGLMGDRTGVRNPDRVKPMLLLNTDGFYEAFLLQLEQMRGEGLLRSDCGLQAVDSVEELMRMLAANVK